TLFYQLAGAGLLATLAALVSGQTEMELSRPLLANLGYQALIISVASYLAWFALLRRYLASRLGVLSLLTPLFSVLFGPVLLEDKLTLSFLYGAAAMIFGVLLVTARDLLVRHREAVPSTNPNA